MSWIPILASVVLVSAIPLTGLILVRLSPAHLQRILVVLVNFAVGALLGGAFFHPLMLGFLVFFLLERARSWVAAGIAPALPASSPSSCSAWP